MGAGASSAASQPARPVAEPTQMTRADATLASFTLLSKMVAGGFSSPAIELREGTDEKNAQKKFPGVVWADEMGLHCGKTLNGEPPTSTVLWSTPGLRFSHKAATLLLASEVRQWSCELKNDTVAGWLATYLHSYLPESYKCREFTVRFENWGALGIRFAMFNGVVIPVVFSCENPAKSLGVTPSSVLTEVNGVKVQDLAEEVDMLTYVSDATWPKICVFTRPPTPMEILKSRRDDMNAIHAPPPASSNKQQQPVRSGSLSPTVKLEPQASPVKLEPPAPMK